MKKIITPFTEALLRPVSVLPLSVVRWGFGLVLLANMAILAPDLGNWYSNDGIISYETATSMLGSNPRIYIFKWLPNPQQTPFILFSILCLSISMFTVGFYPRINAAISFILLTSFHHRNTLILNSGDTLMRSLLFLFMFPNTAARLSIESLYRKTTTAAQPFVAQWVVLLFQMQVALVYASTFLHKLKGPTWLDGTALYYVARLDEFVRFPVPFLFEHMITIKLMTWSSLLVEFALGYLIWYRKLRLPIVVIGVLFHLGIEYTMNIPLFEWLMMVSFLVFIDAETWEYLFKKLYHVRQKYFFSR